MYVIFWYYVSEVWYAFASKHTYLWVELDSFFCVPRLVCCGHWHHALLWFFLIKWCHQLWQRTLWYPQIYVPICLWNLSYAEIRLNGMCLNLYQPWGVLNVVNWDESSSRVRDQYPWQASNFVKNLGIECFNVASSNVGIGWWGFSLIQVMWVNAYPDAFVRLFNYNCCIHPVCRVRDFFDETKFFHST